MGGRGWLRGPELAQPLGDTGDVPVRAEQLEAGQLRHAALRGDDGPGNAVVLPEVMTPGSRERLTGSLRNWTTCLGTAPERSPPPYVGSTRTYGRETRIIPSARGRRGMRTASRSSRSTRRRVFSETLEE